MGSPVWWERYEVDCTIFGTHGGVATPWNGTTIPRRCVLPCTPKIAHSTRPTAVSRLNLILVWLARNRRRIIGISLIMWHQLAYYESDIQELFVCKTMC